MQAGRNIAATSRSAGNLDVFIVGVDGVVYTTWWYAGNEWAAITGGWAPIGGFFPAGASVAAIAKSPDSIDVFISGNDGVVYTSWWYAGATWSGANNNWRPIGGFFPAGAPLAVTSRNPGNLDLFITGNDGVVYTCWWYAGSDWSGVNNNWRPIGGFFPVGARVSATTRNAGNLDLFITGNDGVVYTSWWYDGSDWSGVNNNWRPIGGVFPVGAPVSALAKSPDSIDLFVTGNDGVVYTSWWYAGSDWSGVNSNWRPIGGFFPVGAPVAATSRNPGNLDLFITGNDGVVYTSWWYAGSDWSGVNNNWRPIGGFFPAGAPVSALAKSPDSIDLFVTGNDGVVYTSWWYAGSDWSGVNNNWRPLTHVANPTITLNAIEDGGRFVEVVGNGFSPNQVVRLGYDIFSGGGPTTHQTGEDTLTSDGTGHFVHRLAVNLAGDISGAQAQATDVASGATATGSI